jgi:predicted MFS family arabinose efflux permease
MATLVALALVAGIGARLEYGWWFLIAGVMMATGAGLCRGLSADLGMVGRPRLTFHRRYGLFYALTMLEGCRRQIFITFATYTLVREYHTSVAVISALMFINNLITLVGAPIVGAWTDRFGERRMLTVYYLAIALVFAGYATVHARIGLYALYCLDSLFFLFSVSLTTYLRRIAGPDELTSSLMMGLTFNHVAAVIVPVFGGLIWERWGYENTFWCGVGIVLLSLILCRRVPSKRSDE